ncbi:hypothetical protein DX980_33645 [Burkholderia gladioli]|jgi:hypothetical protein|nr:hypothetical protein CEJ98_26840 [Burkholderia gladioli pv. gladioli]KKJ03121.1 hypothetical protein XF14_30090 [Burkholderia gladioli]POS06520.1 hypothetical protein C3Y08_18725 [Burkholderia gladioli]PRE25411.1 hypothetical protein C6P72_10795 [Burkholderia gladioli]WAG24050.1 hypothetical protein DX980_33645 [Burkholderia gladioli]
MAGMSTISCPVQRTKAHQPSVRLNIMWIVSRNHATPGSPANCLQRNVAESSCVGRDLDHG